MRFVDLLKISVLLSAGAATALGLICVAKAAQESDHSVVTVVGGWWVVATVIGGALGRRAQASPPILRLLAQAKPATMMPEHRPTAVTLNRLWPLFASSIAAGALAFIGPQIPGIAAGFTMIWALTWRQQDRAVEAIEERDGVTFYVERTSPLKAMELVRTPGLRREVPTLDGAAPPGA